MNKLQIDQALSYYEITDNEYKEKCYKCLNHIFNNKKLEMVVFQKEYIIILMIYQKMEW